MNVRVIQTKLDMRGISNISICLSHSLSLTEVAKGGSLTTSACVAIVDASHVEQLLRDRRAHNASSSWRGNQPDDDTATFASHLRTNVHKDVTASQLSVAMFVGLGSWFRLRTKLTLHGTVWGFPILLPQ